MISSHTHSILSLAFALWVQFRKRFNMVKALDNSLVDLDVMPGGKQKELQADGQSGDQGYAISIAQPDPLCEDTKQSDLLVSVYLC